MFKLLGWLVLLEPKCPTITFYISILFRCKNCKGKKTTKDKKIIEIEIDKGAPSDFRKVFYGEVTLKL